MTRTEKIAMLQQNTLALSSAMTALLAYCKEYEIEKHLIDDYEDCMDNLSYYLMRNSHALMNEICEDNGIEEEHEK